MCPPQVHLIYDLHLFCPGLSESPEQMPASQELPTQEAGEVKLFCFRCWAIGCPPGSG